MATFLQQPAQIYKAHLRGHFESDVHRCLATFNFKTYQDESRMPYQKLQVWNEEVLAPKITMRNTVEDNCGILLLPLIGAIDCRVGAETHFITTGQAYFFTLPKKTDFEIQNPYENEQVNYLQIRLKCHKNFSEEQLLSFDLNTSGQLISIIDNPDFSFSIGMYRSRHEGIYKPEDTNHGIFAFALNGAFEFQNRLIENRDGLAIDNSESIEFESLTENALLLLLELKA